MCGKEWLLGPLPYINHLTRLACTPVLSSLKSSHGNWQVILPHHTAVDHVFHQSSALLVGDIVVMVFFLKQEHKSLHIKLRNVEVESTCAHF